MGLFSRHRDDDEEMDEWAYELTRKDSFPLAATVVGGIVILIVAILINSQMRHHDLFATPLGVGTIVALAVWGAAFLITVRHAEIGWKIGSFVAMLVIGLIAGVIGIGSTIGAMQDDLRALSQVTVDPTGGLVLPREGPRGPISKLSFAYFKDISDDARAHLAAIHALGYDSLAGPDSALHDPGLLSHCDKRATVTPMIAAYYARRAAAVRKYRADLAKLDIDENFRKGLIAGLDAAQREHGDMLQRAEANEHAQIGELTIVCQILARRRWHEQFGQFGFTNMADLAEFRTHGARADDLANEGRRLMRESTMVMNGGTAQLRSALF